MDQFTSTLSLKSICFQHNDRIRAPRKQARIRYWENRINILSAKSHKIRDSQRKPAHQTAETHDRRCKQQTAHQRKKERNDLTGTVQKRAAKQTTTGYETWGSRHQKHTLQMYLQLATIHRVF